MISVQEESCLWWGAVWKLGDAYISSVNAVLFWNDDIGNTRDLLSFSSFKMFMKWLKTKKNISYKNDQSDESNSIKGFKTKGKGMKLKEKEKHQVEPSLKGKDAQKEF